MNTLTQKNLFKRSFLAVTLSAVLFSSSAFAALKPFESEKTQQIKGIQPIISSVGAVIVKKGQEKPFVAINDEKTTIEVGDKLYVPVGVSDTVLAKDWAAKGIFKFLDADGDDAHQTEDGNDYKSKPMDLLVEWFVIDADATSFEGYEPVQSNVTTDVFGVPYKVGLADVGSKIGFRITPVTKTGLPDIGTPLDVIDITKISGQSYVDENGNPVKEDDQDFPKNIDPEGKPTPKEPIDNPNIGGGDGDNGGVVQPVSFAKYRVVIVNAKGDVVSENATTTIAYVNSEYTAKIEKAVIENDEIKQVDDVDQYVELTAEELAALKNNIVWKLYDDKGDVVVNTGLSFNASGDEAEIAELRAQEGFAVVNPLDGDIQGRLTNGTLTFKTQVTNADALFNGEPEFSEQGLMLQAILVADDKFEATAN